MRLIPQPQQLELLEGRYRIRYQDRITLDASCSPAAYGFAKLLAGELEEQTGITLLIDRRMHTPHPGIRLQQVQEPCLDREGYKIEISPAGIQITGGGDAGLLYGVQTLRQMIRQEGLVLPYLRLEDQPALSARGLFYDVTRSRIPTLAFLKELADRCSFYKINQLHLYIEHTFLFDGFSEVWRDDTPLTPEDILELDAYCKALQIDLVPSVATLGHLYKVLRTQSFHQLSEVEEPKDAPFSFYLRMCHHTLNVTDEDSLALVYRMIDQFLPLFSSQRFNINGDEPFDLGKGRGKAMADQVGSHQMYVDWTGKICRHVKELGKQPMFWGDIILAHPETLQELPQDVICMNWDYAPEPREDHAQKLWAQGANQYLCPGVQGWKQTINRLDMAYANIQKMASLAHQYQAAGLLVTEWGDFGHLQDPESSVPGILYSAAMGWNRQVPSEEGLNADISVVEYGDRSGQLLSVLRTLSQQVVLSWGEVVEFSEILNGRLPHETPEEFWERFLPRIQPNLHRIQEINETIDACQETICGLMPAMDRLGRKRMLPYLLMSDGQKLLNRLAAVWETRYLGHANPLQQSPAALAADLETWYADYKKLWARSSQESELYRIGETIFWLADHLRQA